MRRHASVRVDVAPVRVPRGATRSVEQARRRFFCCTAGSGGLECAPYGEPHVGPIKRASVAARFQFSGSSLGRLARLPERGGVGASL
jgi:hypothetical protein